MRNPHHPEVNALLKPGNAEVIPTLLWPNLWGLAEIVSRGPSAALQPLHTCHSQEEGNGIPGAKCPYVEALRSYWRKIGAPDAFSLLIYFFPFKEGVPLKGSLCKAEMLY